ncbi:uncharacterized protein LOC142804047 isoform X2 [Rhipicephalus microplus]|uniref:uncharacterized protein LOC142804047 isoform X2 n=1 Tax=Rhipicephalus microplus TaxID=6941 RepID=UPI003F6B74E4
MPTCSAVGCSSSIAKGDKLFVVPRGKNNEERRAVWLHRIGRKNFDCHRGRLCEKHFTMDQYERAVLAQTGIKKLKPNAVASIFAHRPFPKERMPPSKKGNGTVPDVSLDEPGTIVGRAPNAEPVGSLFSASWDQPGTSTRMTPQPVGGSFSAASDDTNRMEASQHLEAPLEPSVEEAPMMRIKEPELQLQAKERQRLLANRKKKKNEIVSPCRRSLECFAAFVIIRCFPHFICALNKIHLYPTKRLWYFIDESFTHVPL